MKKIPAHRNATLYAYSMDRLVTAIEDGWCLCFIIGSDLETITWSDRMEMVISG